MNEPPLRWGGFGTLSRPLRPAGPLQCRFNGCLQRNRAIECFTGDGLHRASGEERPRSERRWHATAARFGLQQSGSERIPLVCAGSSAHSLPDPSSDRPVGRRDPHRWRLGSKAGVFLPREPRRLRWCRSRLFAEEHNDDCDFIARLRRKRSSASPACLTLFDILWYHHSHDESTPHRPAPLGRLEP